LVVFAGTTGAVLISAPLSQIRQALLGFWAVLFEFSADPRELIDTFVSWSRVARARGLASLEKETEQIGDPVLRKAMRLAVDAVGDERIKAVLELEVRGIEAEAETAAQFYETAAGYAPTLGIVGAAIGLIQVMKHLEHIEQVGTGIAAAFVATIYGVLLANLVLLPIAIRIRTRCLHRVRTCQFIAEGVLSIAGGLNPALLRLNLETLLQVPETQDLPAALAAIPALMAGRG
jgi:chemotaxis protein MotA